MQTSTEHSLSLITKKTQILEEQLSQQIEHVRRLQQDKELCINEVAELRSRLDTAEKRAASVTRDFDDATSTLKNLTSEYSKAQLLQKRYKNAVAEQAGFCKAFVCIKGDDDGNNGRVSVPGVFVLADECTINLPSRKWQRSVVVDGAFAVQSNNCSLAATASDQLLPATIESTLGDVISGYNASVVCFGPFGQLKNSLMFGGGGGSATVNNNNNTNNTNQQQQLGLVQRSIRRLFNSLEEHRVTHFSMRMSMGEIAAPDDQFKDLLSEYSSVLSIGRSPDVRCIPIQSESEALGLIQLGLQRSSGSSAANSSAAPSVRGESRPPSFQHQEMSHSYHHPSHKFVVLTIENFDTRGHFRKGTLLFVDLAAPPFLLPNQQSNINNNNFYNSNGKLLLQHQLSSEQLWAQQSSARFCETIAFLAQQQQQQLQQQQQQGNSNNMTTMMNVNSIVQQFQQNRNGTFQNQHSSSSNNNNNFSSMNNNPLENPSGLMLLLAETLGGNSKTSLITCLDGANIVENSNSSDGGGGGLLLDASDNVVATLNTALMMKSVRNSAMAFDVPAELQKLSMETESFAISGHGV